MTYFQVNPIARFGTALEPAFSWFGPGLGLNRDRIDPIYMNLEQLTPDRLRNLEKNYNLS